MMIHAKMFGMFMMNYVMVVLFDTDWKAEIFKRLDALSEKLGVAVGHLWAVLVRQGVAEAVGSIVLAGLYVVGITVCVKVLKWAYKNGPVDKPTSRYNTEEWRPKYFIPAILSGIGLIPASIGLFINLYQAVLWAVNPEYFALQKILELFGK